jgi:threonine synthase
LRPAISRFTDAASRSSASNSSRSKFEETWMVVAEIRDVYEGTGQIIDPHSAIGVRAARRLLADCGRRARRWRCGDR